MIIDRITDNFFKKDTNGLMFAVFYYMSYSKLGQSYRTMQARWWSYE